MGIESINNEQITSVLTTENDHIVGVLGNASGNISGHITSYGEVTHSSDYNDLINKPMIEGVVLEGDKTFEELNLNVLTNTELEAILV